MANEITEPADDDTEPAKSGLLVSVTPLRRPEARGDMSKYPVQKHSGKAPRTEPAQ